MDNKAYALLAILLASVASVALVPAYAATTITVQTDKDSYATGDTIKITGKVTVDTGTVNQPVLIQVLDPSGNNRAKLDQVNAAADGSYSYSFPSGGPYMTKSGAYSVVVTYNKISKTSTFNFEAAPAWKTFPLKVAGQTYPIQYMINGGSVKNMTIDGPTATLTVNIDSSADGKLDIRLPRNVITATDSATKTDTNFEVFIDEENRDSTEATPTADMRQISIPFDNGSETIEIVGTFAIPEFGAIAAIVLAVAIVGIIVATARYSNKLNFSPRL
jgi:predicted secreted protein with PEFG-CTERM motif